jgi:hypothetical protein
VQHFFSGSGSPLAVPEDVIPLLGKKSHWRQGRSAFEVAQSWFSEPGIPQSIRDVLETDVAFVEASLIKAFFERHTKLDGYGRDSQTDLLVILQIRTGVAVLGVEAKVDETFGKLVREWLDGSEGKRQRLAGLVARLGLYTTDVGSLRYQLLHRTVATLLEAHHHGAREAAMVVQSFCPKRTGFDDFQLFAAALGIPIAPGAKLSTPIELGGIRLRLGWAEDRPCGG